MVLSISPCATLDLDMSLVISKLEIEGYEKDFLVQSELEYKRFLILSKKYPDEFLVPTKSIDLIWHAHILFTKKYHEDCDKIFGKYLHHMPSLGLDVDMSQSFQRTLFLYEFEFSEKLTFSIEGLLGPDCHQGCGGCRSDCGAGTDCGSGL